MHIAQAVLKCINVNKMVDSGCIFIFWIADTFALLNDKMGGDLEKIRIVGKYFIEIWKSIGMKMSNVKFLWASEEIEQNPDYWTKVIDISRKFTINRGTKCLQIVGREQSDSNHISCLLYTCMQCNDIFFLGTDICQLGLD